MFKFLFGKTAGRAKIETQRDTVVRVVDELNSVLALMADKPVVGFDLNTGLITVDLPDQMPDEALALPAPVIEVVPSVEAPVEKKAEQDAETTVEKDVETTVEKDVETVEKPKA